MYELNGQGLWDSLYLPLTYNELFDELFSGSLKDNEHLEQLFLTGEFNVQIPLFTMIHRSFLGRRTQQGGGLGEGGGTCYRGEGGCRDGRGEGGG